MFELIPVLTSFGLASSLVSEILLLFKFGQISLSDMDYSPWGSKKKSNRIGSKEMKVVTYNIYFYSLEDQLLLLLLCLHFPVTLSIKNTHLIIIRYE